MANKPINADNLLRGFCAEKEPHSKFPVMGSVKWHMESRNE